MNAYKIMRGRHYKLGSTVLTKNANYGNRVQRDEATNALADAAIDLCSETSATFEQMIDVIYKLQTVPEGFHLPPTIKVAHAERLAPLAAAARPIVDSDFGSPFWESFYERIRLEERSSCPSRLKCYFASGDLKSLRRYKDEHWSKKMSDKITCKIDISGCQVAFKADMVILDNVGGDMNFESARPHVLRYWDQEMSANPNVEILLQGTIVLGKTVAL